jgi:hypothetical protein
VDQSQKNDPTNLHSRKVYKIQCRKMSIPDKSSLTEPYKFQRVIERRLIQDNLLSLSLLFKDQGKRLLNHFNHLLFLGTA